MKPLNKIGIALAAVVVSIFATALSAQAQTTGSYEFATPSGFTEMDHHMAYTWNISGIDLTGKTITGASLTVNNMRNWNSSANVLHTWLLDTSRYTGVKGFYDDNPNNSDVTDNTDDFASTRYHNGKDATGSTAQWLVADGTKQTFMGNYGFPDYGVTGTYEFGATNNISLSLLDSYIRNGNDVAFGLDPDCHYYFDNFKFKINYTTNTTTNVNTKVPEPASLALVAAGLPVVGLIRRRKTK